MNQEFNLSAVTSSNSPIMDQEVDQTDEFTCKSMHKPRKMRQ